MKAADRLFASERLGEGAILAGHFRSTQESGAAAGSALPVPRDTTVSSYPRENIGLLHEGRRN